MMKSGPGSMGKPSPAKPTTKDWSTNKTTKPGAGNSTSAKFVKPAPTPKQMRVQKATNNAVIDASKGTAYRNLATEGAKKKGGMPVYGAKDANRMRLSRSYPRSNKI
jgi:hypothetical protein